MMKLKFALHSLLFLLPSVSLSLAGTPNPCEGVFTYQETQAHFADDSLHFSHVINFEDPSIRGQSMLTVLKNVVKPALDQFATQGFVVANGDAAVGYLQVVGNKVRVGALRAANKDKLKTIADALAKEGAITFYDLPNKIGALDKKVDRYGLTTYLGLASGGGVALRFFDGNYAYNVNYGTGKVAKDPQTGRTFGFGPGGRVSDKNSKGPNDVSDKNLLQGVSHYVLTLPNEATEYYRTLLETLTNSDTRNYAQLSPIGQTLASDTLGVHVAEQIRRLMDPEFKRQQWDASLTEVMLLSSYYTHLTEIWIMYSDSFQKVPLNYTNEVFDQYQDKDGKWIKRKAEFYDYWQRSTQVDPKSKDGRGTRSGINITRPAFRAMGAKITEWETAHHPVIVSKVSQLLGSKGKNLYKELTDYLFNLETPPSLVLATEGDRKGLAYDLTDAMVDFLKQVASDGPQIDLWLRSQRMRFQ